ncbi:MAG TPA: MFS transporter [Trebonia sp.]|nr:MFS transporter [Trebonia sp.]
MTSTGERIQREFLLPYAEIFRDRRARRFSAAGVIGRMPMAMLGLGTVLLISARTGHYGVAGSVAASGSLGAALCAPQLARRVDRFGQRRVLIPLCVVFVLAVAGLVLAVQLGAPDWVLFLPGILAGASMPVLGPMVRARWSALLAGSPRLHTAFSLESVGDELCYMVGPAVVTLLATQVHPAAGVTAAAALCLAGTLWFASQRDTEPPPRESLAQEDSPERPRLTPGARRFSLAAPGLIVLAPVYVFLGGMFVSVDLSTVAFATSFGHKPLAGVLLACWAFGSGVGGLWYGTRNWRSPTWRRFAITLALTVAGVWTFGTVPNLITLALVQFLCGMAIAPTLIAGYSLMEEQAWPGRTTEAMTWLSTGIGLGVACGATAAGFILDAFGARWGYVFAASCGTASVLLCLAGLRRLAGPPPAPGADALR